MYDVLEATQLTQKRERIKAKDKINCMEEKKEEMEKEEAGDYCHIPGFLDFQQEEGKGVHKVQRLEESIKEEDEGNTDYTVRNLILIKKAIRKLKGEWAFEINPPSVDWGKNEIAIEIHCDAGQILTKMEVKRKLEYAVL